MYTIVEPNILIKLFLFQACKTIASKTHDISGIPYGYVTTDVSFKQYTSSIAIIAGGKTFPKYNMVSFGFLFLPENNTKGTALVKNVTKLIITIAIKP